MSRTKLPRLGGSAWQQGEGVTRSIASTRKSSSSATRFAKRAAKIADDTPSAVRDAVTAFTRFIGWIGASVAGLTAFGYAAGYFTVHEHLIMLGFSDVVKVTNDDILLEGGRFFYRTLQQMAVGWMIIIITATAVWVVAWAIYRPQFVRKSKPVVSIRMRLASKSVKGRLAELIPLLAIVIVVLHHDKYYDPANSILGLENLAFSMPGDETETYARWVSQKILSGDANQRAELIADYDYFVQIYALFIAVTWLLIYNRGSSSTFGRAASFLFVIYTVILTAFLPLAFGVLVRTPIYPVANVVLKNGQAIQGLVIQRTDGELTMWNPRTHSAVFYGRDDMTGYEVVGSRDIFAKEVRP